MLKRETITYHHSIIDCRIDLLVVAVGGIGPKWHIFPFQISCFYRVYISHLCKDNCCSLCNTSELWVIIKWQPLLIISECKHDDIYSFQLIASRGITCVVRIIIPLPDVFCKCLNVLTFISAWDGKVLLLVYTNELSKSQIFIMNFVPRLNR